ncbi:sporulation membrane protein YtaF [Bacillus sp. BRMEA1]|uniref:sporulation membrane protein YtaF n=1 Tax=Neobacillus endophyticus TaxID=2738405 RepID=UPI00156779B6|nr:sporulation membrane protein YtaF [Neobacillus endophyticus]NRD77795.1 sporulation membrane protein YtaF [Neobacillus endophyticus]
MHWLTILLIGVAANIDNLGISVSYGLKTTRIPAASNLFIAVISMICAYISITAGEVISNFISLKTANLIGGLLIIFLGGKCITEAYFSKASLESGTEEAERVYADSNFSRVIAHPQLADLNQDKVITLKESILLGLALAMNCLAIGLGAGIAGIPPVLTTLSIGVFSYISIAIGAMIGSRISNNNIAKYSNILSGLLLVMIGVYEIIT